MGERGWDGLHGLIEVIKDKLLGIHFVEPVAGFLSEVHMNPRYSCQHGFNHCRTDGATHCEIRSKGSISRTNGRLTVGVADE